MTRPLYTMLFWLLLPLIFLRLLWRARRQPEYLRHWGERLGRYALRPSAPVLWIHAVSVGETRAAASLVRALKARFPAYQILMTHMTPTGRATAPELLGPGSVRCYLPYDLPKAVARFLAHYRPVLGILLETELWPNLVHACAQDAIPLVLANARLSERSARGYARFQPLIQQALQELPLIAAQTSEDAQRLQALGAERVAVMGNLKFDMPDSPQLEQVSQQLRQLLGSRGRVWLAASTREGEEAMVLDLLALTPLQDTLLILVPRHPQRFDEVASLLQRRHINFVRRSENRSVQDNTVRVLLGDSMGELQSWYRLADVALMGGSLLPFGGQNLIEATAAGCPVLVGPHTYNFSEAAQQAIACGAARRVTTPQELARQLTELLEDAPARWAMREAGLAFTQRHQGATEHLLDLLLPYVQSPQNISTQRQA